MHKLESFRSDTISTLALPRAKPSINPAEALDARGLQICDTELDAPIVLEICVIAL
jgi:hypothetical protein